MYHKLVVFVPRRQAEAVRQAICAAGAGKIGRRYDQCTFLTSGTGTFRPLTGAKPHLGKHGQVNRISEVRIETIVPKRALKKVVAALKQAHPYEEPAFDLYPIILVKE